MRVLLATDGSQDAHAATAWLAQFPLPSDAELRVVSAVHLPVAVLDVPPVHELHESLLAEAQRAAEAARATLASRFRSADVVVTEGDARQVILHAAEAWRAELLVLGARGLGAIAGALLGSISLGVARHARCSVLVVRGGTGRLRGALVAIDGSAHSQAAAEFLARLPLDPAFVVRLLGVAERPPYPATTPAIVAGIVRQAMARIVEERRTALDQALGKAAASFASRVKRVEREVVVGQPVTQILEAAARPDVDLIVAGARGLGTLERLLLGSVSEGVLRHADRPLLIVKTPAP